MAAVDEGFAARLRAGTRAERSAFTGALLDGAPRDEGGRAALVEEANTAFRLNRAVFDDLSTAHRR